MISFLKGKILFKKSNELVIDVNGVGYQVYTSKKISEQDLKQGDDISVFIHLDVKENSLTMFGFIDEKEKEIFKMLLSVSGIGPKLAHTILSYVSFEEIMNLITGRASTSSFKIPGIGPKKLDLISMNLKDKIFKLKADDYDSISQPGLNQKDQSRLEALNALMNLGYQRSEAERIIREAIKQSNGADFSTEELIKKALEVIS
ncbi:MAG TPA: Holliday junction branch migration protein RuvA [Ignavibacteria bacterium]|nr:Holliday junction branch migration protein RuvA [Ignavibacteria bacterium]